MTIEFLVKFYPILTPHTCLQVNFKVRKVIGGVGGVVVACRIILSAPVPFPFLWTLDLGFGTWIWDLDLGLGFGTWIWDMDLGLDFGLTIYFRRYLNKEFGCMNCPKSLKTLLIQYLARGYASTQQVCMCEFSCDRDQTRSSRRGQSEVDTVTEQSSPRLGLARQHNKFDKLFQATRTEYQQNIVSASDSTRQYRDRQECEQQVSCTALLLD